MTDVEKLSYVEIMPRVGELADMLLNHPDPEVRETVEELLDWIDVYHREGLERVVALVKAWRGELFLEQVEQHEIIGPFLSAYDLNEHDPPGGWLPPAPPEDPTDGNGNGNGSGSGPLGPSDLGGDFS